MTMYEGTRHPQRRRKMWPIVLGVVLAVGICGGCALVGGMGLFKVGQEVTSTVAVDSSATVGQPFTDGVIRFTLEGVDCSRTRIGDEPVARVAQGRFCVVTLSATNTGNEAVTFSCSYQRALDARSREYSTDAAAGLLVAGDAWLSQINPGSTMRGMIVFDVPKDVDLVSVVLHGGAFTPGVKVKVQ